MERFFKLREHGTTVRTECGAGFITFMTMAYILAVNPSILGSTGMDPGAVFTATVLSTALSTFIMAFFTNKPFALSAAMGPNAFFAFTVVLGLGYAWQQALAVIFVEGLVFILLSLTNIREAIFNAIPRQLKTAISIGIGLFICFIGLQNAHIIVAGPTLVTLLPFKNSMADGTFQTTGITALLALIGLLVTAVLMARNSRGAILLGILFTWGLGVVCQLSGIYVPMPEKGFPSLLPAGIVALPASLAPTFLQFDLGSIWTPDFFIILLTFLFVDMFDTIGTVIGCASKAGMLDEQGRLPGIQNVLLTDAIGTTVGAILGTSTISTFVESSAGIVAGGRTGLASVVTASVFLLALFFSPIFLAIPPFATAPALIMVGFLMMQQVRDIDWLEDYTEAVPAFVVIFATPFMYSISDGIAFGFIYYTLLHILTGKRERLTPLMYALTVLFVLKYIYL